MFNTELTVVNACLKTLGELRVNDLDEDHSLIPEARASFALCCVKELKRKWWFNTEIVHLSRTPDGFIYVPADTISIDVIETCFERNNYVQRGRRLYFTGSRDLEASFNIKEERVVALLTRNVPYEDLPVGAQELILYSTQLDFMTGYDADSNRFRQITAAYQDAYMALNADHIRNVDVNMLNRFPLAGRLMNVGGYNTNRLRTPGAYRGV